MKRTELEAIFAGTWRITWMELWEPDVIDLDGEARFEFTGRGGKFQFICVHGLMDCRYSVAHGVPQVEFSWDGQDEAAPASGRGVARISEDNLAGRIYFHNGDDSGFSAWPKGRPKASKRTAPKSRPRAPEATWPQLPDEDSLLEYLALLRAVIIETRLAGYAGNAALAAELMDAVENVPDLLARFPDMDEELVWGQVKDRSSECTFLTEERLEAIESGDYTGLLHAPKSTW